MKNIKKRVTSAIVAAATVLAVGAVSLEATPFSSFIPSLVTTISAAKNSITYINSSGATKSVSKYKEIKSDTEALSGGWYVVKGKVRIDGKLTVKDDSYIILTSGSKLIVEGGIRVTSGTKFNVYTDGSDNAYLYAGTTNGNDSTISGTSCGIGGVGAKVFLVGGKIYAKGGQGSYGIQGEDIRLYWTNISDLIYSSAYRGTVSIYSPYADKSHNAAYYNSKVTDTSLKNTTLKAAQLVTRDTIEFDNGIYAAFDRVNVDNRISVIGQSELYLANKSTLTVEDGIGVNDGSTLDIYGNGGKLYAGTRNGSTFEISNSSAGIGSDYGCDAGKININSGVVIANGGSNMPGIGGSNATINITGGTVEAKGGDRGAGIGSGSNDRGAVIKITGGKVTAKGGSGGYGIGSGSGSTSSDIRLSCSSSDDSIYANSYSNNVDFIKTLYTSDGEVAKSNNIAGRTLTSTVTSYRITFNTNGGRSVDDVYVKANNTINVNSLPTPTKSGYKFDGWYTDSSLRYKFDSRTSVTGNITLYAKWISQDHKVTFVYNNGQSNTTTYVADGNYVNAPYNPTRSGYDFTGWYTDRNCYYQFYFDERVYTDLTLYAGWTSSKSYCTITFDAGAGRFSNNRKTVQVDVKYGSTAYSAFPSEPYYTYGGIVYEFDGWYYDAAGNRPYDGEYIYSNTTLYASYYSTPYSNTHTVYFYVDGDLVDTQEVEDGKCATENRYNKGYTWYVDGTSTFRFSTKIYNDTYLYAYNTTKTYTVNFYLDGRLYDTQYVDEGDYAKNNYGSYTWKTGSGLTFSFSTRIYQDYDLSAESAKTYTVKFYLDNGILDTQYVDEGDYAYDPSNGKYTWTTSSGSTFSFYTPIKSDYNLYATSPVTNHTIYFYVDGSLYSTQTVKDGSTARDPGAPYSYSTWDGWYTSGGSYYHFGETVYSDVYLYAKWAYDDSYDDPYDNNDDYYDPYAYDPYDGYYFGSTFGGAGLVAAIVGGVAVVGGGTAAAIAISKKKKKNNSNNSEEDNNKDE